MGNILLKKPRFIKTAIKEQDYPNLKTAQGVLMPEIAVAGRSNVGKSSLLNHLFQSKGLVKTSSTPGKTQAINFFIVDDAISFVDLPGYGFAKVPVAVRKKWGPMIQNYLEKRKQLKLILFLFDIRRLPNDEDRLLLEWASQKDMALVLVLTKIDKVNQSEKTINTRNILEAFNCENLHYLYYSTVKNIGRKELMFVISDVLEEEK